jgi:hypothetical protein
MSVIRRYTYTAGSTVLGGQDIVNLDYFKIYFSATMLIDLVSGEMEVIPEFTMDNLATGDPSTFRWIPYVPKEGSLTLPVTATKPIVFEYPVSAVRLNILSITGEVRMSVCQGLGT